MISKQTKSKLENYIRKEIARNRIKIMEGTKVPVRFVKYFNEFYGPNGLYPDRGRTSPITKQEIQKALDVLLKNHKGYSFIGDEDSVDREEIRDVMMDMGMLNPNYDENTSKLESYIRKIVKEETTINTSNLKAIVDTKTGEVKSRGLDDYMVDYLMIEKKWNQYPNLEVVSNSDIKKTYIDSLGRQFINKLTAQKK